MSMENTPDVDVGLHVAADRLNVQLTGPIAYGWGKKSAGSEVTNDSGRAWLRVQFAGEGQFNSRTWNGEVDARNIQGVSKPALYNYLDWNDGRTQWRASLMSLVLDRACSPTPELNVELALRDAWFTDLKVSLQNLAAVDTDRVNARQTLIDRRIHERFGSEIMTAVDRWVTCHGDLHWANLTHPNLAILDWEGWGGGPLGLDAAFLLAFSSLQKPIFHRIRELFSDELNSRDGRISILFVCAELLRMAELHGDHPALVPELVVLADHTLREMTAP